MSMVGETLAHYEIAAAVVLTAIVAGMTVWNLRPIVPRPVIRFDHELPDGQQVSDLVFAFLAISPDGRWMAYASDESRKNEVYVRPFPDVNSGRWQVSTNCGDSPLWSPDGHELFYRSGDAVMAVSVKTEPGFNIVGTPQILFRGTYVQGTVMEGSPWDIHTDGKQFLMMKPPASTGASPAAEGPRKINIVINWTEELKQQVPVK